MRVTDVGGIFTLGAETATDGALMDRLAWAGLVDTSVSVGDWSGRTYRTLESRYASLRWRVRRDARAAMTAIESALS